MENRIALLGLVIEEPEAAESLNHLLHEYKDYIVGRMGLPYRERGISLISIVVDGPGDIISSLSGKAGMLKGVSAKALYAKLSEKEA